MNFLKGDLPTAATEYQTAISKSELELKNSSARVFDVGSRRTLIEVIGEYITILSLQGDHVKIDQVRNRKRELSQDIRTYFQENNYGDLEDELD